MASRPRPSSYLYDQARQLHITVAEAEDLGYFGPHTAIWKIAREGVITLGLARALLMQLAHPWVAQAVKDHSTVSSHPLQRLVATASSAELLVFGSRAQADRVAETIRTVHTHIHGELSEDVGRWRRGNFYSAEDPDALVWVLATLVDTSIAVYESCFGPLPEREVSAYLRDSARIVEMLGAPPSLVPADRQALAAYIEKMLAGGTVCVGSVARELAAGIHDLPLVAGSRTLWRVYRDVSMAVARSTLPRELARQYRMAPGRRERLRGRVAVRAARVVIPRLPEILRVDPITRQAIRRARHS